EAGTGHATDNLLSQRGRALQLKAGDAGLPERPEGLTGPQTERRLRTTRRKGGPVLTRGDDHHRRIQLLDPLTDPLEAGEARLGLLAGARLTAEQDMRRSKGSHNLTHDHLLDVVGCYPTDTHFPSDDRPIGRHRRAHRSATPSSHSRTPTLNPSSATTSPISIPPHASLSINRTKSNERCVAQNPDARPTPPTHLRSSSGTNLARSRATP